MTKTDIKTVAFATIGVLIAGAILYHAGNLPVLSDARKGLSGQGS